MSKLSPQEMDALEKLLERGIQHKQILIAAPVNGDDSTNHATDEIACVCDYVEVMIIDLMPSGLKHLWVKHNGAKGGLMKAKNAKKRDGVSRCKTKRVARRLSDKL